MRKGKSVLLSQYGAILQCRYFFLDIGHNRAMYKKCSHVLNISTHICILLGWIYEATHRYEVAFYFGGALTLLSAIILVLIPILQRRHERKNGETEYYVPATAELPSSCVSLKRYGHDLKYVIYVI